VHWPLPGLFGVAKIYDWGPGFSKQFHEKHSHYFSVGFIIIIVTLKNSGLAASIAV